MLRRAAQEGGRAALAAFGLSQPSLGSVGIKAPNAPGLPSIKPPSVPKAPSILSTPTNSAKEAASALRSRFSLSPTSEGYAARIGKKIIGEMKLRPSRTGGPEIKNVEILPEFRGMGIGRKLYGEVMRRQPEGVLHSGASVSPDATGVWRKLQTNPSYAVSLNPGAKIQTYNGKEEALLTNEHSINQMDRRAAGLPRLPDNVFSGKINPRALIKKMGESLGVSAAKLAFAVGMGASNSSDGAGAAPGEPADTGRRQRSVIDRAFQRNEDDFATSSMPEPGDVSP